uniref:Thioredoxin H4-1 n=1 Tax=Anthurium amnicola TaxID=1678845 RepID=A0A1D1ZEI1_9ARAE
MGNCICLKKSSSGYESDEKTDSKDGNVHVITSQDSWDERISEARKTGKFVVANFSAAWCVPCRIIARVYVELSEKYPSLIFLTIDVDELVELSSSWDIQSTPTFFFLSDGQQLDKLVGANKLELQKKVAMFADSLSHCSQGSSHFLTVYGSISTAESPRV